MWCLVIPNLFTKNCHTFWNWLVQSFGSVENLICSSNRADVWASIIGNQSDRLTILSIFLYPEGDLEVFGIIMLVALQSVDANEGTFVIIEFPISRDECFHNMFTHFCQMLIECLCVLRTTQFGVSNEWDPIWNDWFKQIDRWFPCQIQQRGEHFLCDGTSLPSYIFFSFSSEDNFWRHVSMIRQISRDDKVTETKQNICCLNISADCCRTRVVI